MIAEIVIICCAYLIGSIPVGYLIARMRGVSDIRNHGSGAIGATNVSRILGWRYFILVFVLDCLKAFICMMIVVNMFIQPYVISGCALALLLGNGFPLFLHFRGGKGVSTTMGILLATKPIVLLVLIPCWIALFLISRTVGIASCIALILLPFVMYAVTGDWHMVVLGVCIMALVLFYHRTNLQRVLRGF